MRGQGDALVLIRERCIRPAEVIDTMQSRHLLLAGAIAFTQLDHGVSCGALAEAGVSGRFVVQILQHRVQKQSSTN